MPTLRGGFIQSSIRASWRWLTASSFFIWRPPAAGLGASIGSCGTKPTEAARWQGAGRRSQGKDEAGGGAVRQQGPVGVEDLAFRRSRTPSDMERAAFRADRAGRLGDGSDQVRSEERR